MAYSLPSIPDDKHKFYIKKLRREVSNLFRWEGLPSEIPVDYLEKTLIEHGTVMFFYEENVYGYMALRCGVRGYNLYDQPTTAYAVAPNDQGLEVNYTRTIVHKYDENIGKDRACVLINNMYMGESLLPTIDHYAYRLALIQQAFDTNTVWQNIPVVFSTDSDTKKLSIEKLFNDIMSGKPWVIVDNALLARENGVQADPLDIPFLLDKLYDAKNEVYNEFRMTMGIDSPGADKAERLLVDEVNSNRQITETCLEIMLSQRKIACEELKKVFGLEVSVEVIEGRGEEFGGSYDRTKDSIGDGEF